MTFPIPEGLVTATSHREGAAGTSWLTTLPALIERFLTEWDCELDGDAWHGEVAIVIPVRRADEPAALKISFPHPGNRSEAPALRQFNGHGAVRLLKADEEAFAMLLERAGKEKLDSARSVEEAIEIAGDLARRLAIPAATVTPALAQATGPWEEELDQQIIAAPGPLPWPEINLARATIRSLASDPTTTMLHGDLHFGNVLRATREPWLTIDPKGWRGTAAFDAFTVVAGRREDLKEVTDLHGALQARVQRYACAAGVNLDVALACVQARATSSYLHQQLHAGAWFDLELLRCAMRITS